MAKKRRGASKQSKQTDGLRILIVEARFYDHISDELLRGATRALDEIGARYDRVSVPGALEIPPAIAIAVDAADETLRVTTVGRWRQGSKINLERPLKLGDELGGHMVAGHVDSVATVVAREDMTDMARIALRAPPNLSRFIAAKGSVALDGVSLTINAVEGDTFSVLIIPHTLKVTTLGALRMGDDVNLEVDTLEIGRAHV